MTKQARRTEVLIAQEVGPNAEDKDAARRIRESILRPRIRKGQGVTIDFAHVEVATQSFVHALIADLIRREGPSAIEALTFRNCGPAVREVIALVVDYSQDDFGETEAADDDPL